MKFEVTNVGLETYEVEEETGVWCESCALPSVVRVRFATVFSATLNQMDRFDVTHCENCGAGRVQELQ